MTEGETKITGEVSSCHAHGCMDTHRFCTSRCCILRCVVVVFVLAFVFMLGCAMGSHGRHHDYRHDRHDRSAYVGHDGYVMQSGNRAYSGEKQLFLINSAQTDASAQFEEGVSIPAL